MRIFVIDRGDDDIDIHLLGDILGRVIRRQAGIEIYELVERIRALTKTRRLDEDPAVDRRLALIVDDLSDAEAELVARAFTAYFELINLAEERHRVRVLRERYLPRVKQIFESLVTDEERHFDQYDKQLDNIKRFGVNYLALQSFGPGEGGAPPTV